jgi:hypothetical protein
MKKSALHNDHALFLYSSVSLRLRDKQLSFSLQLILYRVLDGESDGMSPCIPLCHLSNHCCFGSFKNRRGRIEAFDD